MCELVFISTPADAMGTVASGLTWRGGQGVVHCSEATSLEVFAVPMAQGVVLRPCIRSRRSPRSTRGAASAGNDVWH